MSPGTLHYPSVVGGNSVLLESPKEWAGQKRRHCFRMFHIRLLLEGWPINVKRTYQPQCQNWLTVRKRRRK